MALKREVKSHTSVQVHNTNDVNTDSARQSTDSNHMLVIYYH